MAGDGTSWRHVHGLASRNGSGGSVGAAWGGVSDRLGADCRSVVAWIVGLDGGGVVRRCVEGRNGWVRRCAAGTDGRVEGDMV